MDLGIAGRTMMVTASSSGIGKQCALALAREGARVVMCARTPSKLADAAAEVAAIAGPANVLAVPADLGNGASIDALCAEALQRFGAIDGLAFIGGSPRRGGPTDITESDLLEAFQGSVVAAFRLVRHLLPGMRERGWGRIVTVQSRAVREPIPQLVTSVCTRPGVAGLFKYLSNETARDGVVVNVVVPGRINTERFRQGAQAAGGGATQYVQGKIAEVPVGRLGEAHEVAAAVCFLMSDAASYINGASLQVDGGAIRAI
jgi:3-oxoacyl-[acyl-carrier protein] reductase